MTRLELVEQEVSGKFAMSVGLAIIMQVWAVIMIVGAEEAVLKIVFLFPLLLPILVIHICGEIYRLIFERFPGWWNITPRKDKEG
ncbi:MAG: hypothetical protein WAV73_05565 [Candidatus Moraniibacteriota bacterium]